MVAVACCRLRVAAFASARALARLMAATIGVAARARACSRLIVVFFLVEPQAARCESLRPSGGGTFASLIFGQRKRLRTTFARANRRSRTSTRACVARCRRRSPPCLSLLLLSSSPSPPPPPPPPPLLRLRTFSSAFARFGGTRRRPRVNASSRSRRSPLAASRSSTLLARLVTRTFSVCVCDELKKRRPSLIAR